MVELFGLVKLAETAVKITKIAVRSTLGSTITFLHCNAQLTIASFGSSSCLDGQFLLFGAPSLDGS